MKQRLTPRSIAKRCVSKGESQSCCGPPLRDAPVVYHEVLEGGAPQGEVSGLPVSEVPEVSAGDRGGESRIDTPPVGWTTATRGDLVVDLAHDAGVSQTIEDLLGIRGVDSVL